MYVGLNLHLYLTLLAWCAGVVLATVVAVVAIILALRQQRAGMLVGLGVLVLGVAVLLDVLRSDARFWWITVLPIYLGIQCMRVWSSPTERRARFGLASLLGLVTVVALIVGGVSMHWREYRRQRAIAERIEALDGQVMTQLGSIYGVYFAEVNDAELQRLQRDLESISGLTILQLTGAPVTDSGMKCLAGLTGLQDLGLQNTQITDKGVRHLTSLHALRTLDMMGTRISDEGALQLGSLRKLERVWFDSAVSDAAVEELSSMLPQAEISN